MNIPGQSAGPETDQANSGGAPPPYPPPAQAQYGQPPAQWPTQPPDAVWPPPSQSPTWPPPAYSTQQATFTMPFDALTGKKVDGNVCDFRAGNIWFSDQGFTIAGKAVVPAETRIPINLLCFLFLRLGVIISSLIMEYGFRKDKEVFVPWSNVKGMVYTPKRDQGCLVFNAPNFSNGTVKLFSLAFKLHPSLVDGYIAEATKYVPDRVLERKLASSTSIVVWVLLFALIGIILIAAMKFLSPPVHP